MAKAKTRKEELIDDLLKETGQDPAAIRGIDGLLEQLTKSIVERALEGELIHHLGYKKHSAEGNGTGSSRNGSSEKTHKTMSGAVSVKIPRGRKGKLNRNWFPGTRRGSKVWTDESSRCKCAG